MGILDLKLHEWVVTAMTVFAGLCLCSWPFCKYNSKRNKANKKLIVSPSKYFFVSPPFKLSIISEDFIIPILPSTEFSRIEIAKLLFFSKNSLTCPACPLLGRNCSLIKMSSLNFKISCFVKIFSPPFLEGIFLKNSIRRLSINA